MISMFSVFMVTGMFLLVFVPLGRLLYDQIDFESKKKK